MQELNDDLIRSFEEFDKNVPNVAKVIVRRGIDFARLNDGIEEEEGSPAFEASRKVLLSICAIFREMVECTSEMTAEEFEHYMNTLLTACELVVMVNDGLVCEKENGEFSLTPEGEEILQGIEAYRED